MSPIKNFLKKFEIFAAPNYMCVFSIAPKHTHTHKHTHQNKKPSPKKLFAGGRGGGGVGGVGVYAMENLLV